MTINYALVTPIIGFSDQHSSCGQLDVVVLEPMHMMWNTRLWSITGSGREREEIKCT